MQDVLTNLNGLAAGVERFAVIVGILLAVIALAAAAYAVKAVFGPLMTALQWLFAYAPGERPNDVVAGISFAARMLAWSAVVAVAVWVVYKWRISS
jgi:hypothetical protein